MEFTKKQTEHVLSKFLDRPNGLNEILEMMLNSMMLNERSTYLKNDLDGSNKANGYRLGRVFGHGTELSLRIPRDRESLFRPVILALFREQESYLKEVSFDLYRKGLTTRDVSEVMETIYGRHYSKSSISNFSQSFYEQMKQWRERDLEKRYLALFIDGIQVKVRRDGKYANECFYIIMAVKADYTREIIAVESLPTESSTGWKIVLESLKDRGLEQIELVVSDNLKGLTNAVARVFPKADHQLCVVHLQRNLQAQVRTEDKSELAQDIRDILDPDNKEHSMQTAQQRITALKVKWQKYKNLSKRLDNTQWDNYLLFLNYHTSIRRMIYTTNWIERFNRSARRVLKVRGALPSNESAMALITSVAIDKSNKKYKYPIYNFKFEKRFTQYRNC